MFTREQFTTVTPLSKAIALALFIVLPFVFFAFGYVLGASNLSTIERIQNMNDIGEIAENFDNWVEFRNDSIGISFHYPATWGEASYNIINFDEDSLESSSGIEFSVAFENRQTEYAILGRSEDWTVPRGGSWRDIFGNGYDQKNDLFYVKVSPRSELSRYAEELLVADAKEFSGNFQHGVKVSRTNYSTGYPNDCGEHEVISYNLDSSQISGFIFNLCLDNIDVENHAIYRDEIIEVAKTFEQI